MLALLVWLAGCVFGCWLIWHEGYSREAIAFCLCSSVMLWIVGGLAWIGRKLNVGAAARTAGNPRAGAPGAIPLSDREREALKKIASEQRSPEHPL